MYNKFTLAPVSLRGLVAENLFVQYKEIFYFINMGANDDKTIYKY